MKRSYSFFVLFLFFISTCLFFFVLPSNSHAVNENITYTSTPSLDQITTSTPNLKFTFKSTKGLRLNSEYVWVFEIKNENKDWNETVYSPISVKCNSGTFKNIGTDTSNGELTAMGGCTIMFLDDNTIQVDIDLNYKLRTNLNYMGAKPNDDIDHFGALFILNIKDINNPFIQSDGAQSLFSYHPKTPESSMSLIGHEQDQNYVAGTTNNFYLLNALPNQTYTYWVENSWFATSNFDTRYIFSQGTVKPSIINKQINCVDQKVAIIPNVTLGAPDGVQRVCVKIGNYTNNMLGWSKDLPVKNDPPDCLIEYQMHTYIQLNLPPTPAPLDCSKPLPPPQNTTKNKNPCSRWETPNGTVITEQKNIDDPNFAKKCASVNTGLGITIATTPTSFVGSLFAFLLSIAGMIALFLIIQSGYVMMTSSGNPEKIQAAKETLTSAIVGLLFIIFSLAILQIISADILKIPQFSK